MLNNSCGQKSISGTAVAVVIHKSIIARGIRLCSNRACSNQVFVYVILIRRESFLHRYAASDVKYADKAMVKSYCACQSLKVESTT